VPFCALPQSHKKDILMRAPPLEICEIFADIPRETEVLKGKANFPGVKPKYCAALMQFQLFQRRAIS